MSSSTDKDAPIAISMGTSPAASAAAATAAVSDWLRTSRAFWDSFTRLLASSRISSAFFSTLPSLYALGILIYISSRLAQDIIACVVAATSSTEYRVTSADLTRVMSPFLDPVVGSIVNIAGVFLGVMLICTIASIFAIAFKWPGVLSFWTWVIEVVKCWFIVTFSILICTWQAAFAKVASQIGMHSWEGYTSSITSTLANGTMGIMVGLLLPAILTLQLATSVMTRQRMIFSGE